MSDMKVRLPNRPGPMDRDLADRLRSAAHSLSLTASGRGCDVRDLDLDALQDAASLLALVCEEDRRRRSKCELRQ